MYFYTIEVSLSCLFPFFKHPFPFTNGSGSEPEFIPPPGALSRDSLGCYNLEMGAAAGIEPVSRGPGSC